MANEIKLAEAAREIARELGKLPAESPLPFGKGYVFKVDDRDKVSCCAIGHVINRAGLSVLVKGRSNGMSGMTYRSSDAAIKDVCGVGDLEKQVSEAIGDVVEANDYSSDPALVANRLYNLADCLEMSTVPTSAEA